MIDETNNKFTHIGIEKPTQLQISILSKVLPSKVEGEKQTIYGLVGTWADEAWERAKEDGLVTDAMLKAHWVSPTQGGKKITEKELNEQDGKKLLKAVKVAK